MKKNKKLIKATSLVLASTLLLAACTKDEEKAETKSKDNKGNTVKNVKGDTTVMELKKKYGELEQDDQKVMPFYNVEQDKEFIFDLQANLPDGVTAGDVISVHTDSKGTEESKVLASTFSFYDVETKKTTLSLKPIGSGVLPSKSTSNASGSSWGNAPIYYIKITYDVYGDMKKLDEPIIVPFTIQSEAPVPNVQNEIVDGQFKLKWDAVEGAESYNIYQVNTITLLEQTNIQQSGAETGYKGLPRLVGTVSSTEFIDEDAVNSYDDTTIYQNAHVGGDYYVTAVVNGKESNFSQEVSTIPLSKQLPKELAKSEPLKTTDYKTVKELPSEVNILYVDGSEGKLPVTYEYVNDEYVIYKVKNTLLKGRVYVDEIDKASLEAKVDNESNVNSGYIAPDNESDQVPDASVPTIIETESSTDKTKDEPKDDKSEDKLKDEPKEDKSEDKPKDEPKEDKSEDKLKDEPKDEPKEDKSEDGPKEEPKEEPSGEVKDDLTTKQKENTEKVVEEGNNEEIVTPDIVKDGDYVVNADTAFEEYLALKLINGDTEISLKAFPEAQNITFLQDTFLKVMYQNPMILGVSTYAYDYGELKLIVTYEDSNEVIKQKQKEIVAEANKIVKEVVKGSMSDDEKRLALYDYLEDNTKYDDAALESAEENNFIEVDPEFNDAFTTYGIMVKKVGVCASYAATYQMLLDLAGVESVVVTGDLNGLPHAWNKVKIEDEWYHIDSTNNEVNAGIPYMAFQLADETAKNVGLNTDKDFWLDNELSNFVGTNTKFDYYEINNMNAINEEDFKNALANAIKNKKDSIIIRLDYKVDENEMVEDIAEVINDKAPDKLETAQLATAGNYVLITLN